MAANFMHVGQFHVTPENRDAAISVMKRYEDTARQAGLDHAHLVEDDHQPGRFWHVTMWARREDWVAIEESDAHQTMHAERAALLSEEIAHDYFCGHVRV